MTQNTLSQHRAVKIRWQVAAIVIVNDQYRVIIFTQHPRARQDIMQYSLEDATPADTAHCRFSRKALNSWDLWIILDNLIILPQLRPLCRSLPAEATNTLVRAFILCRLDYCNFLLYGVTDKLMRQVWSVQYSTARLITGAKRRGQITPILRRLQWLPVRRRVEFKIASLVQATKCCQAKYLPIWLTIFISPQKVLLAPSDPFRGERALSLVFTDILVTDVLLQLDSICQTTYLEQLTCQSARQGSQLHRIQKTTENIHVSDGLRRIVTFLIIEPYKYSNSTTLCYTVLWVYLHLLLRSWEK